MCVELRELRSNGAIRISVSGKSTFDTHIIIIEIEKESPEFLINQGFRA